MVGDAHGGSPGWFQFIMARVREGLVRCRLYIDDLCTSNKNGAEHVNDLSIFLERLIKSNLELAPKKTHPEGGEVTFLGHRVSADVISADSKKVDALRLMPMLTTVTELRSLMRGLSYYRNSSPKWWPVPRPSTGC
ncbi:unnamed protein product [Sphacelaria rigidula]